MTKSRTIYYDKDPLMKWQLQVLRDMVFPKIRPRERDKRKIIVHVLRPNPKKVTA